MAKIDSKYKLRTYENGFSLWLNGSWILDSSTILKDGSFTISDKHFKKKSFDELKQTEFKLKKQV